VYASHVLHCSRVPQPKPLATLRRIRNTRYGWLVKPYGLSSLKSSQQGLSPCKKQQASLVAHQGRTASYPTAPSQIPACGTTAPGFSKLLASHTVFRCLEVMTDAWFYQLEIFQQRPEPGYVVTSLLATAVEPFVEYLPTMMEEIMQTLIIAPDTVVLLVSPQLLVQFRKQLRFRQMAMGFTPCREVD
jgi:hypothetical protein